MNKTKIITAAEMAEHYKPLGDLYLAYKRIEKLEADKALLREALEEFVASTGVSDDPDVLLVDALVYENAMRVLGLQK